MKLLIVDGNSILNRAFYGVKNLSNRHGVPTNAIFGFFNILLKAQEDTAAEHIIIAFDLKEKTFRHKACSYYKANRHGMPEDLAVQMPYTKQILAALGYPIVTCAGWEADDILGTLSAAFAEEQHECVLLTGDRDNFQLISERVSVRYLGRKEPVQYTEKVFREEYGFDPIHMVDLKALMGDTSDNIPGVKGVGDKTAMQLIQTYGTIDAVYTNLDDHADIKKGVKEKLKLGEKDARESYWLAAIVRDAPVSKTLSDYERKPVDGEALSEVLTELELYKLMERLNVTASAAAEPADVLQAEPMEIVTLHDAELEALSNGEEPLYFLWKEPILYLAWQKKAARIVDPGQIMVFFQGSAPKYGFETKAAYHYCLDRNAVLQNVKQDAAICAYLLNPSAPEYTIQQLCAGEHLPYPDAQGEYAEIMSMPLLSERLSALIAEQGMEQLFSDIEMPLVEVLANMEHCGVSVDAAGVRGFGDRLQESISEIEEKIHELAGRKFNILSPKQLGTVLFEDLQLPTGKKTKTGWSTNAEVLEALRTQHPIVEYVLEYRQLSKLLSTYVEGLLKAVSADGKIHTSYQQTETRTGRLSSTEPNLQNIPVRTPLGSEMRKFFVASEGCVFLDADYSQIELRLVAHLCNDENMRNTFAEGLDIHRSTAAKVFNMPEDMVTKEMRSAAKAVNFGIIYGISAFSLSKDIGVTVAKADRYIKDYFQSYPNVERFMNETVESARALGFVTTLYGRKRYVPELRSSNKNVQAAGKRIAMNTPIQGTAADIIKAAMVKVYRRLKAEVPEAKLILQIHDELIVEVPHAYAESAAVILKEEMEQVCQLSVPLTVDVQEGGSWYETH
ncbi:MAG: DNA polymerase I [Oscillospiraceae bacterium]|nr:DNA polymerase I [Oscillospiraceae bacterium]